MLQYTQKLHPISICKCYKILRNYTQFLSVNVTTYSEITPNFYVKFPVSPAKNVCTYGSPRLHKAYTLVDSMRRRGSLYKRRIQRPATIQSETCWEVGSHCDSITGSVKLRTIKSGDLQSLKQILHFYKKAIAEKCGLHDKACLHFLTK